MTIQNMNSIFLKLVLKFKFFSILKLNPEMQKIFKYDPTGHLPADCVLLCQNIYFFKGKYGNFDEYEIV